MAEAGDKLGKAVSKVSPPLVGGIEKKLRSKGFDPISSFAKNKRQEKSAERKQKQDIGKQKQNEELRLAEAADVIGRKKFLAEGGAGGSESLITTRRLKKIQNTQALVPKA